RAPVEITPSTQISTPSAARIHQNGCVAVAKSVHAPTLCPCGAPASAPSRATPTDTPIWRLVDATAEANPACARGMPDTAANVTGALTMPKPTPKSAYTITRAGSGVCGCNCVRNSALDASMAPLTNSEGRAPWVPTRRPESGDTITTGSAADAI